MNKKKYQWKDVLYAGFDKTTYIDALARIQRRNREALALTSFITSLVLFLLLIASSFVPVLHSKMVLYACFLPVSLAIYISTHTILRKREALIRPVFYLYLVMAYLFAIFLGVMLQATMPATTFCVLEFALPLLIIDRPLSLTLLLVAVNVVFCLATALYKSASLATLDVVNAISFLILGAAVNYFVMRTKISEVISRTHIEKERDTDDLTKLMTKAAAAREISTFMQEKRGTAALLVVDIDNFKQVNDRMGHAYGDAVLRIMGNCIREAFRSTDILARFGGDEFVLFLPYAERPDTVEKRVEDLVELMNSKLIFSEQAVVITGSIGIAFFPQDAATYEELFKKADEALYLSKGKGKNCYTFYLDPNLDE